MLESIDKLPWRCNRALVTQYPCWRSNILSLPGTLVSHTYLADRNRSEGYASFIGVAQPHVPALGLADGVTLRDALGLAVGVTLRNAIGLSDGVTLRDVPGLADGVSLGDALGVASGASLGNTEVVALGLRSTCLPQL